jgi:sugar lactone lactonase YvrE
VDLEVVSTISSTLGEGPLFHEGHFYWVDIIGGKLNKLTPGVSEECLYHGDIAPTSVVPGKDGALYLTLNDGFYKLTEKGPERMGDLKIDDPYLRFNDGKCDPSGNYWAGTMDMKEESAKGSLYILKPDGELSTIIDGVTVSNGLCWNDDMTIFYYVDSATKKIMAYDLDPLTLVLGSNRTVFEVKEADVFPDGMSMDLDGNLWLALWNGYAVLCIDPNSGEVLQKIEVPCKKVTSCCFGGDVFQELYITTASKDMTDEDWQQYPDSGKVFKATPGIIGLPADSFGN